MSCLALPGIFYFFYYYLFNFFFFWGGGGGVGTVDIYICFPFFLFLFSNFVFRSFRHRLDCFPSTRAPSPRPSPPPPPSLEPHRLYPSSSFSFQPPAHPTFTRVRPYPSSCFPEPNNSHVSNTDMNQSPLPLQLVRGTVDMRAQRTSVLVFPLPLVWSAVLWIHDSSEGSFLNAALSEFGVV